MKTDQNYSKQFKPGTMPKEPISPLGPLYREAAAPSKPKKIVPKTKKRGK